MTTVSFYQSAWNLHDPKIVAETLTSTVYRVTLESGDIAILKILNEKGRYYEGAGPSLLEWFDGAGAIRVLRHDGDASLLEYASGPDLMSLAIQSPVADEAATQIIIDVVKQLHAPRVAPPPKLLSLREYCAALFDRARLDGGDFTRAAALAEDLLTTQTQILPLHGDLHHDNILNSARGWLAIDPQGTLGDPIYDIANIFPNPNKASDIYLNKDRMRKLAATFAAAFGWDVRRVISWAAVHGALSASWCMMDGDDPVPRIAIAKMAMELLDE